MLGILCVASLLTVTAFLPFTIVPLLLLPLLARSLNAFSLGEQQAFHLGVRTGRVKRSVLLLSTMAVGATVAVSGVIGFIGLVIPPILRMGVGSAHRMILPVYALLGAILCMFFDFFFRTQ